MPHRPVGRGPTGGKGGPGTASRARAEGRADYGGFRGGAGPGSPAPGRGVPGRSRHRRRGPIFAGPPTRKAGILPQRLGPAVTGRGRVGPGLAGSAGRRRPGAAVTGRILILTLPRNGPGPPIISDGLAREERKPRSGTGRNRHLVVRHPTSCRTRPPAAGSSMGGGGGGGGKIFYQGPRPHLDAPREPAYMQRFVGRAPGRCVTRAREPTVNRDPDQTQNTTKSAWPAARPDRNNSPTKQPTKEKDPRITTPRQGAATGAEPAGWRGTPPRGIAGGPGYASGGRPLLPPHRTLSVSDQPRHDPGAGIWPARECQPVYGSRVVRPGPRRVGRPSGALRRGRRP